MQPYRERLKPEILAIAERIVATEGLTSLQARRVAKEGNCAVGSVYNVFGDLDGLVIAVNDQTLKLLAEPLNQAFELHEAKPIAIRLTELALAYMRFAFDNRLRWRAVFDHRLPAGHDVPAHYRLNQARLLALIEKIIANEIKDEHMRAGAARALFASVHGIIALSLDNKIAPFDPENVESQIRFIVKAVAGGLSNSWK